MLDALIWVRRACDPSLAIRYSCINANVCKECTIAIDGRVAYACTTRLRADAGDDARSAARQAGAARSGQRDAAAARTAEIAALPCATCLGSCRCDNFLAYSGRGDCHGQNGAEPVAGSDRSDPPRGLCRRLCGGDAGDPRYRRKAGARRRAASRRRGAAPPPHRWAASGRPARRRPAPRRDAAPGRPDAGAAAAARHQCAAHRGGAAGECAARLAPGRDPHRKLQRDKGVAMAFTSIRHALGQLEGRGRPSRSPTARPGVTGDQALPNLPEPSGQSGIR